MTNQVKIFNLKLFFIFLVMLTNLPMFLSPSTVHASVSEKQTTQHKMSSQTNRLIFQPIAFRGRRLFNANFSQKIFSQRDWSFWDWGFLIVFILASLAFVFCLFHMFSDSSRLPEHILFAVACLSGAIALPWYLSLFAIAQELFQVTVLICLAIGLCSSVYLLHEWIKMRRENKKPDIFIH